MPKVDIVLALMQAYCASEQDPRVTKMYADVANLRNTYQWICQNQPDNGDVMAHDCYQYAVGLGPKPSWLTQGGL